MFTTINYNPQRKASGDKYFLQYPNGNNIAALWKMFGCIRLDHEENIRNFEFRLFDSTELAESELKMVMLQLPLLFPKYEAKTIEGTPTKVILTPKEEITFLDNTEGLTDKRTVKIVTKEEYEKLRSSIGFIA